MSDEQVAEIARSLTKAQRTAVFYFTAEWSGRPARWTISNAARSARAAGLLESRPLASRSQDRNSYLEWRLTPLGLRVRALLLSEKNDG